MTNASRHFTRFCAIAPMAHALWRACEAAALHEAADADPHLIAPPILDLGCGFGEFSGVAFDHRIDVGIDINADDIASAALGAVYRSTVIADARTLPFPDASFGSVMSISVLEHLRDIPAVMREAFRVLRPGGRFAITVPTVAINALLLFPPPHAWWLARYHRAFKHETIVPTTLWTAWAHAAGFRHRSTRGTMTRAHLMAYECGLPIALPTQLTRKISGRRLLFPGKWRAAALRMFSPTLPAPSQATDANVLMVFEKPV